MNRYTSLAVLLCAAALASCEKNAVQDITGTVAESRIKFFNFGVGAPGVNFYADETKMTAISSGTGVESTTGVTYGGVGAGGLYSAIEPGQRSLTGRIAATTDKDRPISTLTTTIEDGKFYSFYQSGFYNATTKTVDSFIVEDPLTPTIDYSVAYVRFVHAMSNANPMTLYAVNASGQETAIAGPVAYKGAGAFTALPNGVYQLRTRYAGSMTNVITRADVSFSASRVYTITARGDITVTSTTATNRPFLDNTINR
jgi:hypothetical protein